MDKSGSYSKILEASNYLTVPNMSEFVKTYIEKLVYNISMYVDADFTL